jgi:hypothetical protein
MNALQPQGRFDRFVNEFNTERPHEALDMQTPAEIYTPASRTYGGLPELDYPFHDKDVLVTACGRICVHRKKSYLCLRGEPLRMAERGGFEPPRRFPAYTLSRRAPSTTRPPLRVRARYPCAGGHCKSGLGRRSGGPCPAGAWRGTVSRAKRICAPLHRRRRHAWARFPHPIHSSFSANLESC